jgi:hypothetical protein
MVVISSLQCLSAHETAQHHETSKTPGPVSTQERAAHLVPFKGRKTVTRGGHQCVVRVHKFTVCSSEIRVHGLLIGLGSR